MLSSSRVRRLVTGAALVAVVTACTGSAFAARGTAKTPPPSAPLTLVSDATWNNPNSPSWCFNEDDYDEPVYSGSVNGSYAVNERLCGLDSDYYNGVYWDAGGIGLETDVYVTGQLNDLSISAPDGSSHHAVLVGQTTSKGTTTYHYAACYVPAYSVSTDTGGYPLPGGDWRIGLSGQSNSTRWNINLLMTDAPFQQSHCPASQQNLVS